MSATIHRDCPNVEVCGGEIEYFEEEGESYTAHGLSVWSFTYLLMSDPGMCSAGCLFSTATQERLEREATDDRAGDYSWLEP